MQKPKLESYMSILEALVVKPLTLDHIAYETDMDCTILRQRLDFLIQNNLVEKRESYRKTLYAIKEKGVAVLRTLNFPKYLEKIANDIRVIDEALEIIRTLEKNALRKESRKSKKT